MLMRLAAAMAFAAAAIGAAPEARAFFVPTAWQTEIGEDAWVATAPPNPNNGHQVWVLALYPIPYQGDFAQWVQREAPQLVEAYVGQIINKGALTQRFRARDPNGINTYGPANTLGFWQIMDGGGVNMGAWIWAYPTSHGAQIVAAIFRDDVPLATTPEVYDAALAIGKVADYAQPLRRQDFEHAAGNYPAGSPSATGVGCEKKQFYNGATRSQQCDFAGKNCRIVSTPQYSWVTVCPQ
jgi:hypothetical protein